MGMLKKKVFMVFVAISAILIFLCLPVFGATDDEQKPPEDEPAARLAAVFYSGGK